PVTNTPAPPTPALPTEPPTPALPTATPTITLTPTPTVPMVTPKDVGVNCRLGPSTAWEVVGWLLPDQWAEIKGKDAEGNNWWYIENPTTPGTFCFVSGAVTVTAGNLAGIPTVPTPKASVTAVNVEMNPKNASITCGMFPFTFDVTFTITTNGPTEVTFQRILSNGNKAPPETVTFDKAETKEFNDYYRVGAVGDYWFKVKVTSPNQVVGKGNATMSCTP
ncbi:MAG: hypothetical protein D6770_02815, partial [Anaerolineae bacterium]